MKYRIRILSAVLTTALFLSSCATKAPDVSETTLTTENTTTAPVTTTAAPTETTTAVTEPPEPVRDPNTLYIVDQGKTEYTVVLPGGSLTKSTGMGFANNAETGRREKLATTTITPLVEATSALVDALNEKTGAQIPVTDDSSVKVSDAGEYEILIGLTDRPESVALHKKLKERTFAVQTTATKLVIVGYDDNMTVTAIRYCLENYIHGFESIGQVIEQGVFTVPAQMEAISGQEPQTPANTIHIGGSYTLKEATLFSEIAKDGNYKVMQGAATDGL